MIVAKNTLAVLLSSALSNEQKTLPITDDWLITRLLGQCTEVRFATFLSDAFTTMAVMNPPEKKLEKRTSAVHRGGDLLFFVRYSESTGWKIGEVQTFLKRPKSQVGDYFKFLWPFQNVRTLDMS